jgi:hypothetical protein
MHSWQTKKLKPVCEVCSRTPKVPRKRCIVCGKLVCVSSCWNKQELTCNKCVHHPYARKPAVTDSTKHPSEKTLVTHSSTFQGYQPRSGVCSNCGKWSGNPCEFCGKQNNYR